MERVKSRLPHHIHLIGIGGIGLSAIARVLLARGHMVTGSDLRASPLTEALERLGARVFIGHAPGHIRGAEMVVVSSAVPAENPEVQAACQAGVPVLKRRQFLPMLLKGSRVIAVAGTHGKTTTSAMIAFLLERLGRRPSFIVGGIVNQLGTNAQAGEGPEFVIEADEYERMFCGLEPDIAVVTNVEMDHPDCYVDLAEMREAFGEFLAHVPRDGWIVACADSLQLEQVIRSLQWKGTPLLRYGSSANADYVLEQVRGNDRGGVSFSIRHEGKRWVSLDLSLAGRHNALN
ncbi:MAG: UDP-N-acetylmuramate--L-alanine ligase, partial [Anaerolineae bacterium]|nr:UDP-N-acetylmuramate--L-alanine ligase [Anaerolineae bacterium]